MGTVPFGVSVECGWISSDGSRVSNSGCKTEISSDQTVTCYCYHLTDFVLIITGDAARKKPLSINISSTSGYAFYWALSLASVFSVFLSIVSVILGCFGKYVMMNMDCFKTFSIMTLIVVVKCISRAVFYGMILLDVFGTDALHIGVDGFILKLIFGTLTQFCQFMIFGYLLCLLTIVLFSIVAMSERPLAVRRVLNVFQIVVKVLIISSLIVPLLLIYGSFRFENQSMFIAASVYILALNVLLTLSIPALGIMISRFLVNHSQSNFNSATFASARYIKLARFMRFITTAMGLCLSSQAALWAWSVTGPESYLQNFSIGSLVFSIFDALSIILVLVYQYNVVATQYRKRRLEENNIAELFGKAAQGFDRGDVFFKSKRIRQSSVWDNVLNEFATGLRSLHKSFDNSRFHNDASRPW